VRRAALVAILASLVASLGVFGCAANQSGPPTTLSAQAYSKSPPPQGTRVQITGAKITDVATQGKSILLTVQPDAPTAPTAPTASAIRVRYTGKLPAPFHREVIVAGVVGKAGVIDADTVLFRQLNPSLGSGLRSLDASYAPHAGLGGGGGYSGMDSRVFLQDRSLPWVSPAEALAAIPATIALPYADQGVAGARSADQAGHFGMMVVYQNGVRLVVTQGERSKAWVSDGLGPFEDGRRTGIATRTYNGRQFWLLAPGYIARPKRYWMPAQVAWNQGGNFYRLEDDRAAPDLEALYAMARLNGR
jgi:cytochrome c-type biogenesis protein CcmE